MQDSIPQRKGALQRPWCYPRTPETLLCMLSMMLYGMGYPCGQLEPAVASQSGCVSSQCLEHPQPAHWPWLYILLCAQERCREQGSQYQLYWPFSDFAACFPPP
ncbi:uncharacterized protein VK521_004482 isoform 1-T1 [Ammospiza maritima maritima]